MYLFFKPNFALLAKESRKSTGSSGEEKYIYGDFHAFRNVSNNSTNSLDEVTPVRKATKVHEEVENRFWRLKSIVLIQILGSSLRIFFSFLIYKTFSQTKTGGKNLSLAWTTDSSNASSTKTQIERAIDSKYFMPAKPTELTQIINKMGIESPEKVSKFAHSKNSIILII